jgi:uncharacterized membrane protein YeiB
MGLSLMTSRSDYTDAEKKYLRSIVIKRSWFLFAIGLVLYNWWPGDILHFYGGYMHIAAFLIFIDKKYFLVGGCIAIIVFHLLLLLIPIETGWNFIKFQPVDFWTISGFIRNTLYNGWNSIFPWIAYFFLGMWLGRLDWDQAYIRKRIFITALTVFVLLQILRFFARSNYFDDRTTQYVMSEYFPPYLPFMMITGSFALMVIVLLIFIGKICAGYPIIQYLAATGKLTLSHYIIHLTLGMVLLSAISGKPYTGNLATGHALSPIYIIIYSVIFFAVSIMFSVLWLKWFRNGPFETVMRRLSR